MSNTHTFKPSCIPQQAPFTRKRTTPCRNLRTAVRAVDTLLRERVEVPTVAKAASGSAKVVFLGAGGQSVTVDCPLDTYVLDAGLEAGVELPYTCRGGICGACVGKVVRGKVDQSDVEDLSFTLDDSEQEQGMALLCMSRPLGDVVIETQSDWGYSLGVAEWKGATGEISGRKVAPLMGEKWDELKK